MKFMMTEITTLTRLAGAAVVQPFPEPEGILQQVLYQPRPGIFASFKLTGGGVIIAQGKARVALTIADLWQLAEPHLPVAPK